MKKYLLIFLIAAGFSSSAYSQLMVSKMLGKNADNSQLGYGFFTFLDFPLGNENTSIPISIVRSDIFLLREVTNMYSVKTRLDFISNPR